MATGSTGDSVSNEENKASSGEASGSFECNICFDTAKDAVVSMCGHLFCWPCIFQWMEARRQSPTCPVCKSVIDKERLIPLYGRGNSSGADPRATTPPRPQGQREEPTQQNNGGAEWGFQDGIQFSFGIGAFPFMFFGGPVMNLIGGNQGNQDGRQPPQNRDEQILARIFMAITLLVILWLIMS